MASHHEPVRGSGRSGLTTLEKALETIVHIYHEHAIRDKKDDFLSLKDLTSLLKKQTPEFLSVCDRKHPEYIKGLFKESDEDKNKDLTFEEFTFILGKLADDAHRISHGDDRCGPDMD